MRRTSVCKGAEVVGFEGAVSVWSLVHAASRALTATVRKERRGGPGTPPVQGAAAGPGGSGGAGPRGAPGGGGAPAPRGGRAPPAGGPGGRGGRGRPPPP